MQTEVTPKRKLIAIPPEIKTAFLLGNLLTLVSALVSLTLYFRIQPQIPIFYSLAEPAQQLAPKEWLFLFPGLSVTINVGHLLLLRIIDKQEKLLLKLFAWTTVLILAGLLLALLRILYIIS